MGNQYMRKQPTIFWVLAPIFSLLLLCIAEECSLSYGCGDQKTFEMIAAAEGILVGLFAICVVGSAIVFIVDVWKNEEIFGGGKIGWTLLLLFLNILVFPIYYYRYLRDRYSMTEEKMRKEVLILTLSAFGVGVLYFVWFATSMLLLIYEYDFMWVVYYVGHTFMFLLFAFVILVYIFLVCSNENMSVIKKILWMSGVIFLGVIFWPLYLWLHMYRRKKE